MGGPNVKDFSPQTKGSGNFSAGAMNVLTSEEEVWLK
jgi:hypothetical protein